MYLFGSHARNNHDNYSDLDILIISDHKCLASENKAILLFPQWIDRVSFSYYSLRTMLELYKEGDLFSWHLYLEAKHLCGKDILKHIGKPHEYRKFRKDIAPLIELFLSIEENLIDRNSSVVYEAGLIFLCIRNIGHSLSWFNLSGVSFEKDSCINIEKETLRPSIDIDEIVLLRRARGTSVRGSKYIKIGRSDIVNIWNKLKPWVLSVGEFTEALSNE